MELVGSLCSLWWIMGTGARMPRQSLPCKTRSAVKQQAYVHLDGPIYLRGSNIACLIEGAADPFNDVYKDLVSSATVCALGVQHRLDDTGRAFANCVEERRGCCFPLHMRCMRQGVPHVNLAFMRDLNASGFHS